MEPNRGERRDRAASGGGPQLCFWMHRGHFNEAYGWLAAAVTPREVDVSVRTVHQELSDTAGLCARLACDLCALSWVLAMAFRRGMRKVWRCSRPSSDRAGQLEVLGDLGMLFVLRGDFGQGQAVLDEGLAWPASLGMHPRSLRCLFFLGPTGLCTGPVRTGGRALGGGLTPARTNGGSLAIRNASGVPWHSGLGSG